MPLVVIFGENKGIPQQAVNRIQHWAWTLAVYKYSIAWRKSEKHANAHANADALSRLPLPEAPTQTTVPAELVLMLAELQDAPVTAAHIANWTKHDSALNKVLWYVQEGWPSCSRSLLIYKRTGVGVWNCRRKKVA